VGEIDRLRPCARRRRRDSGTRPRGDCIRQEGQMSSMPVQKRRLTVAIIVRNAAEALAETLVCVRNLADEIVVLDTGSTDETPMIAEKLGANLQRREWQDDFAAARNACLTFVSGDWVLWLDAGERIGKEEGRLLREFID